MYKKQFIIKYIRKYRTLYQVILTTTWLQIETQKLDWKRESKVGSLDNADHRAGGGDKKVSFLRHRIVIASLSSLYRHVYSISCCYI